MVMVSGERRSIFRQRKDRDECTYLADSDLPGIVRLVETCRRLELDRLSRAGQSRSDFPLIAMGCVDPWPRDDTLDHPAAGLWSIKPGRLGT